MEKHESKYRSFLVRLWREEAPLGPWRVMVEEIGEAGRRRYFKDLDSLLSYLQEAQVAQSGKEEGPR